VVQRQEERLAQQLTVWVAGLDARGNRFQQTAKVVDISRQGARLSEIRCLHRAGELIELKCRGRRAQFRVVWIDDFTGQVGVRCLEPSKDLWGVTFPPPRPVKYEPTKAIPAGTLEQRALRDSGGWISGTSGQVSHGFIPTASTSALSRNVQPKQEESRGTAATAVPAPMPERRERKHARLRCNGGAEVRREHTANGEKVWGRITQVSLGGCYVAAMHPFAPQTKVALFLGVQDIEVRAKGVVCRSQPGLGMGIMFTEVDEHNQRGLEILTTELAKGGRYSQFA
jgi:PilZ domain